MDSLRPYAPIDLIAELLQGYRHAAAATNDRGEVVCMNAAALGEVDREEKAATAVDWPPLVTFKAPDGQTFTLRSPARPLGAATGEARDLPPRLAKVASLVIDGLTDKQIAQRLGLSFSTVRTYVRHIYRRMSVHSRVGLVHATRDSPVRAGAAPSR